MKKKQGELANISILNDIFSCIESQKYQGESFVHLSGWLSQFNLKIIMDHLFGEDDLICNKMLPGTRYIPDFVVKSHKIIVEYDGPRHYTQHRTCMDDIKKDNIFNELGYKVMRIPYFIQPRKEDFERITGADIDKSKKYSISYVSGFVHPECVLPADYCESGLERFKNDLLMYPGHKNEIFHTLNLRNDRELSLPKSMSDLLKDHELTEHKQDTLDFWNFFFKTSGTKKTINFKEYCAFQPTKIYEKRLSELYEEWSEAEIEDSIEDCFYQVYQELGGKSDRKIYDEKREIFTKYYIESKLGSPSSGCSVIDPEYGMILFNMHIGDFLESLRIFHSLDVVAPIT